MHLRIILTWVLNQLFNQDRGLAQLIINYRHCIVLVTLVDILDTRSLSLRHYTRSCQQLHKTDELLHNHILLSNLLREYCHFLLIIDQSSVSC